jgi:3-phenylpropionate/trans-cinnamate dioxygenase ferredoxin reductase component
MSAVKTESAITHYDVVIVGGGQAATSAATELRQLGYQGSVAIIEATDYRPYSRPALTKEFLLGAVALEDLYFRTEKYWKEKSIDVLRGIRVEEVDPDSHCVRLADGRRLCYESLIWAAGARCRDLLVAGADAAGICVIRTVDDAMAFRCALESATRVVIIGAGFIGLEAAANAVKLGHNVTVVEAADRILGRSVSSPVAEHIRRTHSEAGVRFYFGETVQAIRTSAGRASGVVLSTGVELDADLVLVGIGVTPNVEPLVVRGAAEVLGGILIDGYAESSLPDVYAVGDCATFSCRYAYDGLVRLESVQNASALGRTAARAVAGRGEPVDEVPWFWSNQYDVKFKSAGLCGHADRMVVRGEPSSGSFSVLHLRGDQLVAVETLNRQADYVQARTLLKSLAMVRVRSHDELTDASVPIKDLCVTDGSQR